MALPAMIAGYGQQSANYGTAIGESLMQLGKQVGQTLAMQEYQRQAASTLPIMQEQINSAFADINAGKPSDAYSKITSLAMNPAIANNPFLLPGLEVALKGIGQADDSARSRDYLALQQSYYDRKGQGTTGGGGGTSAGAGAFFGGGTGIPSMGGYGESEIVETALQQPSGGAPDYQSYTGEPYQQPTPQIQEEFAKTSNEYLSSSPQEQSRFIQSQTTSQQPAGTKVIPLKQIPGLPGIAGIALPVQNEVEVADQLVLTEGGREGGKTTTTFKKKVLNEEELKMANKWFYEDLKKYLGFVDGNASVRRIFNENPISEIDVSAEEKTVLDREGKPTKISGYTIGIPNKPGSYISVNPDTFEAAQWFKTMPVSASMVGISFIQDPNYKAPVEPAKPAEEPKSTADKVRQAFGKKEPEGEAKPASATAPAKEMTLEEQIASETSAAATALTPTRRATPEQLEGIKKSKIAQNRSTLESEKRKLESLIYDVSRATGQKTFKRGLTEATKAKAKERISEINKQLEAL